jgi:hypothetical protein
MKNERQCLVFGNPVIEKILLRKILFDQSTVPVLIGNGDCLVNKKTYDWSACACVAAAGLVRASLVCLPGMVRQPP